MEESPITGLSILVERGKLKCGTADCQAISGGAESYFRADERSWLHSEQLVLNLKLKPPQSIELQCSAPLHDYSPDEKAPARVMTATTVHGRFLSYRSGKSASYRDPIP